MKRVFLGLGISGFAALIYFGMYGLRTTSVGSLRGRIEQNVKLGSKPEAVIRFLDQQHLEHSEMFRLSEYESPHRKYGDALIIEAIKRGTWRSLLLYESIQIFFVFDEGHKLIRIDLSPVYTGL